MTVSGAGPTRRVLVVRLSAMGDVVQAAGAVRALCEARPDDTIGWAVQRPFAPLIACVDPRIEVLEFERSGGPAAFLRCARSLRAWRPDVVLDLQGNWKSSSLAWLSGAALRFGVAAAARREAWSAWLANRRVGAPQAGVHPARQAAAVVRAYAPSAPDLQPVLTIDGAAIEREFAVLEAIGIDAARPFRVVVLSRADDPRGLRGGLSGAAVVAGAPQPGRVPTVALCGPDEVDVPAPDGVPRLVHARGEVRRLVALGALVARAGGSVLGPDKGASHVLAAAGAPTTVLFGPTDPSRTGPPGARALRSPRLPDCAPCRARTCRHPSGPVCMEFHVVEGRAPPHAD